MFQPISVVHLYVFLGRAPVVLLHSLIIDVPTLLDAPIYVIVTRNEVGAKPGVDVKVVRGAEQVVEAYMA